MIRNLLLSALVLTAAAACGKKEETMPMPATEPVPEVLPAPAAPPPMPSPAPEAEPAMPQTGPATPKVEPPAPKTEAAPTTGPAPAKPAAKEAVADAAKEAPAAPKAAATMPPAGMEAAKAKYTATCASCHGKAAAGQGAFPKLAGQTAADLATKLKKYRAGEKIGPMSGTMFPFAKPLSDQEIDQLAAYIAGL